MTLDEAIKHAEEVANEKERLGAMGRGNPDKYAPSTEQCFKCAEEHRQLAEWLKELKRVREQPWLKELKRLREQKRPHGKWEFVGNNLFKCTHCGYLADADYLRKWKRYTYDEEFPTACPNCGADMREGDSDA